MEQTNEAVKRAYERMDAENAAHSRGEEVEADRILNDAREAAHYCDPMADLFAGQGYDPRSEPRTVRECGMEYEDEPFVRITLTQPAPLPDDRHDDHVRRHYRLLTRSQELRDLIELCWVFKTGRLITAGKLQGSMGGEAGPDRAEIAAEYLESTETFGELLWPVIVAVGEGRFTRQQWTNRRPSFSVARALWRPFMVKLVERLAREPFETYYQRRARELYTVPLQDHLEAATAANF